MVLIGKKAANQHLLFAQCCLPYQIQIPSCEPNSNCHLEMLYIWTILKFCLMVKSSSKYHSDYLKFLTICALYLQQAYNAIQAAEEQYRTLQTESSQIEQELVKEKTIILQITAEKGEVEQHLEVSCGKLYDFDILFKKLFSPPLTTTCSRGAFRMARCPLSVMLRQQFL